MFMAGGKGLEPLTFGFGDHCSTIRTTLLFSCCPFRLLVRTSLFHGEETGSIPVGDKRSYHLLTRAYGSIPKMG